VASFAGGLVRLPGGQELGVDMGLPSGLTYACAAETMIAAHLGPSTRVSVGGQLDVSLVARLREEGRQLGFRVHVDRRGP
jgi:predicted amino acid dehydrogenase